MKYATEFDVGDIIKNPKFPKSHYLIIAVGKRSYIVLSFADGNQYPIENSDYYHYQKVS